MLSFLGRLPFKMLLESGDCTHSRFHPDFGREFQFLLKPALLNSTSVYSCQGRELHFINRWMRCLDPEMWEIADLHSGSDCLTNLPTAVLSRIISCTSLDEMKTRRLVSKRWNKVITSSETWATSAVAVIDSRNSESLFSYGGIGSECASYLSKSTTRFFNWKTMRLKHLTSRHIHCLITYYATIFRRSVKGIERLEMEECSFHWPDLLELLDLFTNMTELIMDKCSFELEEALVDNMLLQMGWKIPTCFEEVMDEVNFQCPEKDYFFGSLKSIELIEEDTHSTPITPTLLSLLKSRCGQLDNFILILGRGTAYKISSDKRSVNYWKCVHSFLAEKNVLRCHIVSRHSVAPRMINRFLTCMAEWRFHSDDKPYRSRMKELTIDLKPFSVWFGLQKHLIPVLHRLSNLEVFTLKNVVLRGNGTSCLREIHNFQSTTNPSCLLKFGIILDDQGGAAASAVERELLVSKLYRENLTSVEVVVQTDAIREIRDMIPYSKKLQFPLVEQFTLTTNSTHRPRFFTFNLNTIVHNFPGLVELKILDGPPYEYNNFFSQRDGQWAEMSGAMFGDEDLQLVLKSLVHLRVLMLRVNMRYTTDAGFTGVATVYCTRLVKRWRNWKALQAPQDVDVIYKEGVDFSTLKNLEYLSIDGVGPGITDVTALLAFQNVSHKLKYLGLFGSHKVHILLSNATNARCFVFRNKAGVYQILTESVYQFQVSPSGKQSLESLLKFCSVNMN